MFKRYLPILSIAAAALLTSCSKADDVIDSFDRVSYISFVTNMHGQGVSIVYDCYASHYDIHIDAGEEKQLDVDMHWDFATHAATIGSVYFNFDDGTTLTHSCQKLEDGTMVFDPADGNILNADRINGVNPTWTISSWKGSKMRYDYVFK